MVAFIAYYIAQRFILMLVIMVIMILWIVVILDIFVELAYLGFSTYNWDGIYW